MTAKTKFEMGSKATKKQYTMKKSVKAKWIKALKSGDYKQGTGRLRDKNDNFCCLGVLCNIYAQEHPEIAIQQTRKTRFLGVSGYCPDDVYKWARLGGVHQDIFIDMNDSDELTFSEIADFISKNIEGV